MTYHPVSSLLGVVAFLLCLAVAGLAFVHAIRLRFSQVTLGKRPEVRWDNLPLRLKNFGYYVLAQGRMMKNGYLYSGLLHIFIFGAFMVLAVDTINFTTDGLIKSVGLIFGAQPEGLFHLPGSTTYYQGLADTFRFLCIVGLGMAFVNRLIIKPKRLPLTRDAFITLFFILGLMVFEVMQQGFYLAMHPAELEAKPYIWFSGLFARLVSGLEQDTLILGYRIAWWAHLINLLSFSNYVPFSKHSHVFAAPLNIFFMDIQPRGRIRSMDLNVEGDDAPEYFGMRNLEDLSWKQIYDGLACTECGRCNDNCPAHHSDKPLHPMEIITGLRDHAAARIEAMKGDEKIDLEDPAWMLTSTEGKALFHPDVLWSCTTCRACMEVCPVGNEHIPDIIDMRRYLTMGEGKVGHGGEKALRKMDSRGNPWGMSRKDREKWAAGLDVKIWDKENPSEYLYWVGCAGAYDSRAQKVTQSMVRLMRKAGVDFAILGRKENCTGDSARRLGDEYLFQQLAEKNITLLNEQGVKKIMTHCPHCFNTFKNEYPEFGGHYEVVHHSVMLAELIAQGKLTPGDDPEGITGQTVVYHDSCYLGRFNDIYDPQRELIDALPGIKRVEPERTRKTAMCCGAGGGQMWMELDIGTRMNYVRTDQLLETKPDVIAVACNFCMLMIDDGVKARGRDEEVQVVDIAEMLDRRINGGAEVVEA